LFGITISFFTNFYYFVHTILNLPTLKKNIALLFFLSTLFIYGKNSCAQTLRYSVSMPYISFGAYSTQPTDPFSFTNNQAALAQIKKAGVGVFGEQRFLLAENSVYGLAVALPTSLGNFGLQVQYAGFKNFNEHQLGLAYARKLGKLIDLGVQFNYYGYQIPQYGNATSVNFEIGAIMHFTHQLNGGIHVYNPVGSKMGKAGDEQLASAYKFGLGYNASDQFYVSAEMIKEENKPVNVVGGVQYQFAQQFFVRAGFISETGGGFAGVGLGWKNIRLDVSGSYHPQLGISPGLLLIVHFKERQP
jgi:hypothetical protein